MEVIVELLLELFGEVLLGSVLSVFGQRADDGVAGKAYRLLGYATLGALLGGLSLYPFPRHRLSDPTLRLAWLFAAPVVGGLSMSVTKGLLKRQDALVRLWPMLYGGAFVGVVNLVRYFFCR